MTYIIDRNRLRKSRTIGIRWKKLYAYIDVIINIFVIIFIVRSYYRYCNCYDKYCFLIFIGIIFFSFYCYKWNKHCFIVLKNILLVWLEQALFHCYYWILCVFYCYGWNNSFIFIIKIVYFLSLLVQSKQVFFFTVFIKTVFFCYDWTNIVLLLSLE